MLTKLEHQLLEICFSINAYTQTFPFSWSQNGFKRLGTDRTIWQKIGGIANIGCCVSHFSYVVIRLIPGFGYTPEEYESLNFSVLMNGIIVMAFSVGIAIQLAALAKAEELASIGNQLLNFNKALGKKLLGGGEYGSPNLREKLFCGLVVYLFLLAVVGMPGLSIVAPESKYTLFSILPSHWKSKLTLLLTVLIEAAGWARILLLHFFVLYIGHAYILTNKYWFEKISSEWITSRRINLQRNALNMYRSLTILNTMYNNGSGSTLFPLLKSAVEISGIFSLYATIRFHGTIVWFAYYFFVAAFIFCYTELIGSIIYMATVYEKSVEFHRCFGKAPAFLGQGREEVKRSVASCRPLVCRVSVFFFVEKDTKLIYMSLLSNILIHVLLGTSAATN